MNGEISDHFTDIQELLEHIKDEHCGSGEAFLKANDIKNKLTELEMELDRLKDVINRNEKLA